MSWGCTPERARGHVSHTGMSPSELDQSLRNGKEDIAL